MRYAVQQAPGALLADLHESGGHRVMVNASEAIGHQISARQTIAEPLVRHVVQGAPFPPLLEEERHTRRLALVAQVPRPIGVHGPGLRAALAADNDPVEVRRVGGG